MQKKSRISDKEENSKIMHDMRGLSYDNALKVIQNLNLTLRNIYYEESSYNRNIVIKQSIEPGINISKYNEIDITLSGLSPIRFLPSIYKTNDEENNDFLKRYLWIFYHFLNQINIKLDNIHTYFNPMIAPTDFFHWLASWVSININYAIPEHKMRLLVKEIIVLYQWRGTVTGLS